MSGVKTWANALDELEARLRRQSEVAHGLRSDPPDGEFEPPPGPLPPELADRARALLAQCRELQAVAAQALASQPRPTTHVYGQTSAGGPGRFGRL